MNLDNFINTVGPKLQSAGDSMARGVDLAKKMTAPVRYGLSTLESQIVRPFKQNPKTTSNIITSPAQTQKPSIPIGRKYQNYLDQVNNM